MASAAQYPVADLFGSVAARVGAMGRRLGEGADADLHNRISEAVTRLRGDNESIALPEAQIEQMRADLFELVDKAEEIAKGLPDYQDDLLGERSYFPALSWFCPRPPFCY